MLQFEKYVGVIGAPGSGAPLIKRESPKATLKLLEAHAAAIELVKSLPDSHEKDALRKRLVEMSVAIRADELRRNREATK